MSRKNNQNENGNQRQSLSEEKKAAVLGNDRKKVKFPIWLVAVCVVVIAGVVAFMAMKPSGGPATIASTSAAVAQETNDAFTFQASLFDDGKAHHFDFTTPQGINVRYFILKSSDGIIRAAYDACDVCWRSNKGYSQDGDVMVCNNCGRRFASVQINEIQGGCNPAPLKRTMENNQVVITKADIAAGRNYFDFSS